MTTKKHADSYWSRDDDYGKRLDQVFAEGEQFLAMSIECDDPFTNPTTGEVYETRTKITARALDPESMTPVGLPMVVKTLANSIYTRASESTGGFPAVVMWRRVPNKKYNNEATILERVSEWPLSEDMRAMLDVD